MFVETNKELVTESGSSAGLPLPLTLVVVQQFVAALVLAAWFTCREGRVPWVGRKRALAAAGMSAWHKTQHTTHTTGRGHRRRGRRSRLPVVVLWSVLEV